MDSQERFEGLGVQVIRAWARFISPAEVQAGEDVITARRFVIATGSQPLCAADSGAGEVPYLTNETIFALRERPEHLMIIGGGPIGMEMAQAHRRLGCAVTVIEGGRALGRDDPEAAALVLARLAGRGGDGAWRAPVVTGVAPGPVRSRWRDGRQVAGSHLLLAVGRKPALERLNLAAAGVELTPKGVTVDAASADHQPAGLCDRRCGGRAAVHPCRRLSGRGGAAAGGAGPARQGAATDHIPWVTYTDPELAQVGLTEAEARAARRGPDRGARRFAAQ